MNARHYGTIGAREVMWWAVASFLGLGRLTFPREFVTSSGMGAAYAFALMCALTYGSTLLIVFVMRHFPGQSAIDVAVMSLGWVGRVFESLMGAIMTLILAETYRLFAFMLHESMLQHTPAWVILALAAIAAAYGTKAGVEAVSRSLQLLTPLFLVIAIVGFIPAYWGVRLTFLIPHWAGWRPELLGTYRGVFILSGLQNVFIFAGFARPHGFRKSVIAGITVDLAVLALVFAATVGSFGVDTLPLVSWPGALIARAVDLHGFYIERIGYVSMIAVTGAVILFLIQTTLTSAIAITQILALKPRAYPTVGYALVALSAGGALLIPNVTVAEAIAVTLVSPLTLFMLLLKPVVLWVASAVSLKKAGGGDTPSASWRRRGEPRPALRGTAR